MPTYGDAKVRDMVRSVLPSKARKRAKAQKDALHRWARRRNNHQLHLITNYEDSLDDETDLTHDYSPHRTEHRNCGGFIDFDIVYDRRDADHLNHFERWAYWRTINVRPEDRFSYIKAQMNAGVLGYHAMTHLRFLEMPHPRPYVSFDPYEPQTPNRYIERSTYSYFGGGYRYRMKRPQANHLLIGKALRTIIEMNKTDELNAWMRRNGSRWHNLIPVYYPGSQSLVMAHDVIPVYEPLVFDGDINKYYRALRNSVLYNEAFKAFCERCYIATPWNFEDKK